MHCTVDQAFKKKAGFAGAVARSLITILLNCNYASELHCGDLLGNNGDVKGHLAAPLKWGASQSVEQSW